MTGTLPPSKLPLLLVGNGRLATHWKHFFHLKGIAFTVTHEPHRSYRILLAISDHAIEPWVQNHTKSFPKSSTNKDAFIHFSGALTTPLAFGYHPLMTFGKTLYDLSFYDSIPFIGEIGQPHFREVFPEFMNPFYVIESAQKPLYHALSVLGGNFSQFLFVSAFQEFEKELKLPRNVLLPFFKQALDNAHSDLSESLTGPLVRGDQETIQKNQAALMTLENSKLQSLYAAFAAAFANSPKRVQP